MPTIRAEFHRLRPGAATATRREVGSSVCQVFDGSGTVRVGESEWTAAHGDLFVVPSWQPLTLPPTRAWTSSASATPRSSTGSTSPAPT